MARTFTVAEIMDPDPPTVGPEAKLDEVVRLFREHDLSGLPVVNSGGHVMGIITENDLVIGDAEGDLRLPHFIELFGGFIFLDQLPHPLRRFEERLHKASAASARDLMTADPITVAPTATAHEAARLIARRRHNRLPVVDGDHLVGMVTRADVLDALTHDDLD